MQHRASKLNIPMRAACVLLCLVLISVYMMSGLYARYVTSADGEDSAAVARFSVTDELMKDGTAIEGFNISFNPRSSSSTYKIAVENKSEVAVRAILSVENKTGNLPISFDIEGTGASHSVELQPLAGAGEYTLTVGWDNGVLPDNNFIYNGRVDKILITIRFEQID